MFTSVLRPNKDVRIPRMEFNPTSRASSGIWEEYCSTSFRIFTASWMVWTGAWDYRSTNTEAELTKMPVRGPEISQRESVLRTCTICWRDRSHERQCCWNRSLELSLTSMESRQRPSNLLPHTESKDFTSVSKKKHNNTVKIHEMIIHIDGKLPWLRKATCIYIFQVLNWFWRIIVHLHHHGHHLIEMKFNRKKVHSPFNQI